MTIKTFEGRIAPNSTYAMTVLRTEVAQAAAGVGAGAGILQPGLGVGMPPGWSTDIPTEPCTGKAALKGAASDLMTRPQAAAYLGVAEQTLAVWKATGRYGLPVVKLGRLVRYRKADLDAFIQEHRWLGN